MKRTLTTILPMIVKSSPLFFFLFVMAAFLHGLSWVGVTVATQYFFDAVARAANHTGTMKLVYVSLAILGVIVIGQQIINGLHNFLYIPFNQKSIGYIMQKVHKKIAKVNPVEYENPQVLDAINKANEGIDNVFGMVFTFIMIFSFFIPYVAFMGVYLYMLKPVLSITLIISSIPLFMIKILQTKVFTKLEDESAPIRREYDYYEKCLSLREYLKETRFLGAYRYFNLLYHDALVLLNSKKWKAEKKSCLMDLAAKIFSLTGFLCVLYLFVQALLNGDITAGAFAAVFASIAKMQDIISGLIDTAGDISKNMGSINNLLDFLNLPDCDAKDTDVDTSGDIVLKNTSFRYPGAKKDAICNVNLTIKGGETIAIVGQNGAGKSTLVRLVTGIYFPTYGQVTIAGKETRNINRNALFCGISGVFQKFQKYQMTLRDNIHISDLSAVADDKQIMDSIKKADLDMNTEIFTDGLDTMLCREFEGIDLSGGQWQRVAIARGFNRKHNIIILDEPTAAIDPVEESKIYKKFSELSKGITSILVTHRLGSARIADKIVVLDHGEIVEVGNHETLMKNHKKYYEMFELQSKWYVQKN